MNELVRLAWRALCVWYWAPTRRDRHRALIRRIEELEVELGFREAPAAADRFELRPGARWLVNEPTNFTQILPAYGLDRSALAVVVKNEWTHDLLDEVCG